MLCHISFTKRAVRLSESIRDTFPPPSKKKDLNTLYSGDKHFPVFDFFLGVISGSEIESSPTGFVQQQQPGSYCPCVVGKQFSKCHPSPDFSPGT